MLPLRRAALRFISAPSVSFATRSRTIASVTYSPLRIQKQTSSILFQRRWASDETKQAGEVPISQLQPTPQEEVENVIQEDSAAQTETSEPAVEESPAENSYQPRRTSSRVQSDADVAEARSQPKQTVYVGNLFFDVTEDDLTKEMSRFGTIERIRLVRDARGLSKGFGYVTFGTTEEATKAIEALNQQLFEGRRLNVNYANSDAPPTLRKPNTRSFDKPINPPSKTLFIGNMSWEMTDKDLNAMFKGIKNIIDVRVAIDRRTGQPRGFAHADFADVKSAMEGMKLLEGKEVYGRKIRLDYSFGPNNAPRNQARDQGDL